MLSYCTNLSSHSSGNAMNMNSDASDEMFWTQNYQIFPENEPVKTKTKLKLAQNVLIRFIST